MSEELKPCPFCGGEPFFASPDTTLDGYCITCECGAGGSMMFPGKITIEEIKEILFTEWNTRPIEDQLQAELDKYRWIPVEEPLPKVGQLIISIHTEKKLRKRLFIFSGLESDIRSLREFHTHWMPIPTLPEQSGDKS